MRSAHTCTRHIFVWDRHILVLGTIRYIYELGTCMTVKARVEGGGHQVHVVEHHHLCPTSWVQSERETERQTARESKWTERDRERKRERERERERETLPESAAFSVRTGSPRARAEVVYVDLGYWAFRGSIHPKGDPALWGIWLVSVRIQPRKIWGWWHVKEYDMNSYNRRECYNQRIIFGMNMM